MSDRTVIPSLAHVVRGLTLLFWAVPALLLTATASALDLGWRRFGYAPPVIAAALLVYGLIQLRHFQPQERIWSAARQRALILACVLLALSPLPIWWSRAPEERFFLQGMLLLALSGPVFLIALNDVLLRLAAMLPDQTLRTETLFFSRLNTRLLMAILIGILAWLGLPFWTSAPDWVGQLRLFLEITRPWLYVMALLLPIALTMTLLWKTKDVIMHSVFGA